MRTEAFGKEKFLPLDLVRGVAALVVALAHFAPYGGYTISPLAGGLCVAFFFILSGYVLAHAYGDRIADGALSLRAFATTRIARLYPLHIVTFGLVGLYWGVVALAKWLGLPLTATGNAGLVNAIENITMTHLLLDGRVSFNSPSWSIGVEFWGGFLVFALCLGRFRTPLLVALVVAFIIVEVSGGLLGSKSAWAYGFLPVNYVFGAACIAAGWAISGKSIAAPAWAAWGTVLAVFFALLFPPQPLVDTPILGEMVFLPLFVLVILLLAPQRTRGLFEVAMRASGEMSYGIYLWHVPVMLGLATIARLVETWLGIAMLGQTWLVPVFLAILLPLSWGSFRFFEARAKTWVKRALAPRRSQSAG